jgi:hypothetical protein
MTTELLQELGAFLARDPLSVQDVIERIGPAIADPGVPMAIELRPGIPGIGSAKLWRYPETGLPYLLRLEPSAGHPLAVCDVAARLGPYDRSLRSREAPPEIVFGRAIRGDRWSVKLLAEYSAGTLPLEEAPLISFSLRRDPIGSFS